MLVVFCKSKLKTLATDAARKDTGTRHVLYQNNLADLYEAS